jgi:hypothetical protein
LFSLSTASKYKVNNSENAIWNYHKWGPCFGYDLVLFGYGNQSCKSVFPYDYSELKGIKKDGVMITGVVGIS